MENETEIDEPGAAEDNAAQPEAEEAAPMNRAQKRAAKFHKAAETKKFGAGQAGGRAQAGGSSGAAPPKPIAKMKKG